MMRIALNEWSGSPSVRAVVLTCVAISTIAACPASAVDQEEARAAAAAEEAAVTSVPGTFVVDGVTYRWTPYVETEAGYDSNPDNLFFEDGWRFVKLEAGLALSAEAPGRYAGVSVRGRFIDYQDFEDDIQERTDVRVTFEGSADLTPSETVKVSGYFLRDYVSLSSADLLHGHASYAFRTEDIRFRLQTKSHTENNFEDSRLGLPPIGDFGFARPDAFDYNRNDAQAYLLTFARSPIQPFAIVDAGIIDYFSQEDGALLDRDASERYAIAGVRFQMSPAFRIDGGYRLNVRDFDNAGTGEHITSFVDINVFWQPVQALRVTGIVERYFDEPDTSYGVADDVQSYGVTVDWDVAPKLRFVGTTYYDREPAIEDDRIFHKITTTGALTYDFHPNVDLFVSGLAKWVEEDIEGFGYQRLKIGAGARMRF